MQPLAPASAATNDPTRDLRLWQIAKRRAKFQGHLLVYALVNGGLWALYFLLPESHETRELPWPIWSTLFWGFAVVSQGLSAYSGLNRGERTQREYERLRAQQSGF